MHEKTADKPLSIPKALSPRFITRSPNAPLRLFTGEIHVLLQSGREVADTGTIELAWLPSPSIRFSIPETDCGPDYDPQDIAEAKLEAPEIGLECAVTVLGIDFSEGGYRGMILDSPVVGQKDEVDQILFEIPNFYDYLGTPIREESKSHKGCRCGRLELRYNDFHLTLDSKPETHNFLKQLRAERAYGLTHTARISREAGKTIDFDSGKDLVSRMSWFFSFLRGQWCSPILPSGRRGESEVWNLWKRPKASPWVAGKDSWFPGFYMSQAEIQTAMNRLFEGFMEKWEDPIWNEPIQHATHWYVVSNLGEGGIEGAVILIQAALELLAWVYFVEEKNQFSNRKFDDAHLYPAKKKIELLLTEASIDQSIPASLQNLSSEMALLKASDGPEAITNLRNALVHPKKSKRDRTTSVSASARYEIMQLGVWYLEMMLLFLFGYDGSYYSRFSTGTVKDALQKVPWA